MGRFRRGDLILNSDKKITIDSAQISDNGTQLEVNKSIKVESIELASGPVIDNISNDYTSDSTSELMTSKAVQDYIVNATAGFSTGTDAVGSITQPRPDILSSQLFYGANGAEIDPNFDHWNQTIFNDDVINSGGTSIGAPLTSGLFASIIEARASGGGYSIRYYDESGTVQYSTRALTHIVATTSTLDYPFLGLLNSGGCYFRVDWYTSNDKQYLVAVNRDCSKVIEHYFGNDNYTYQYGTLPNDDIVILRDETPTKLAIYRPDFDSSSFIIIQDFTEVTGDISGVGYGGANIKYLGNNKIVCTRYTGAVNLLTIIDISTNTYIVSNGFSEGSGSLYFDIFPDKSMCLADVKGNPDYKVVIKFFDENLNALTDTIEYSNIDYVQGACYPTVLPDGKHFILFYYATYPNFGWMMIDKQGNLIDSGFSSFTGIPGFSGRGSYLTPSGKLYLHSYTSSDPRHIILDIPLKISQLDAGGTIIDGVSSDQYERSSTKFLDTTAINRKFYNDDRNLTENLKPFMVGDRSVGVDFKDTYNAVNVISRLFSVTLAYYNNTSVILENGDVAIFYTSGSNTSAKVTILDPLSQGIKTTTSFTLNAGETASSTTPTAILLNNGIVVCGFGKSLVAIDQSGNEVAFPYYSGYLIRDIARLPNDEIFVYRYNSGITDMDVNRLSVDIDSSSFVEVSTWQSDPTLSVNSWGIYYIGDGEFMSQYNTTIEIFDINGTYLRGLNTSTEGTITAGRHHYNKANGLIYSLGYYSTVANTRIVVHDKHLNLIDVHELDVTMSSYGYAKGMILPNGDFVIGFRTTEEGITTYIIKPDGRIIKIGYCAHAVNPTIEYGNYCCLPNGRDFLLVGNDANLGFRCAYYSRDIVDEPSVKQKLILDYANSGTHDYKIVGYERKSIYANNDNYTGKNVSVAPFRSGKYAVIYTDSAAPGRPVISIYDKNDNLLVDKKFIFLGYNMPPTGIVSLISYPSVDSFIHNDWVAMTFTNETSNENVVIVCDEDGEQPCYPLEFPNTVAASVLDDDKLFIIAYNNSSYYSQGTGYYPQIWEVDTDSSSFIQIVGPQRSYFTLNGTLTQISKNRMIAYRTGWRSIGINNFGTATPNPLAYSGGQSLIGYNPPAVTPDNRIFAIERSGASGSYVYTPFIYQYNPDDESMEFIVEGDAITKFFNNASSLLTPIVSNNGNVLIGGGISATYEYGIYIFNSDGKWLNPNGPFSTAPAPYIPEYMYLFKGLDGTIYSTNHRSGGTWMLVDKWFPIIRKESPLKYTYDVRSSFDQTAYITVLTTDHSDQLMKHDSTSELALTIPSNTNDPLPIGFRCSFSQLSTGAITFSPDGGVTITSPDSNTTTNGAGSFAEIVKIDTNTWLLTGDLT